jgi:hypothetical protein
MTLPSLIPNTVEGHSRSALRTLVAASGECHLLQPPATRGFGNIETVEEVEEVIALLGKSVALLNEAVTASPERQVEIRMEFDCIIREIDKIRLRNQN